MLRESNPATPTITSKTPFARMLLNFLIGN